LRVDAAVSGELVRVLARLGIEAALHAIDARAADNSEVHRQAELALTQARYEAGLARRQYDAVDPDNRLVASELERRSNDRLVQVYRIEEQLTALVTAKVAMPSAEERTRLIALGADVEVLWHHPGASVETRKHILRTAIVEIVAKIVGDWSRRHPRRARWGELCGIGGGTAPSPRPGSAAAAAAVCHRAGHLRNLRHNLIVNPTGPGLFRCQYDFKM
jgi:hypothetical protein